MVLLPGLLAAWLGCASPAAADNTGSDSGLNDGMGDVPPTDIVGWFVTFDPSNQWTTAANIATMEAWLTVAEEMAAGPVSSAQLDALGMDGSEAASLYQVVTSNSDTQQNPVPEPGTLGLLGASLAALALYTYVSLRRTG